METLGQFLKREREFRRVPLETVAQATRIKPQLLESIEADRLESVPRGVFLKSFLKSYCLTVGLNPDEVAARFAAVLQNTSTDNGYEKFGQKNEKSQVLWLAIVIAAVVVLAAIFAIR